MFLELVRAKAATTIPAPWRVQFTDRKAGNGFDLAEIRYIKNPQRCVRQPHVTLTVSGIDVLMFFVYYQCNVPPGHLGRNPHERMAWLRERRMVVVFADRLWLGNVINVDDPYTCVPAPGI